VTLLCKRLLICLAALVLVFPTCLSCGNDSSGGKVEIVVGQITDLSGAGAPALEPMNLCLQDMVQYFNEEELIEGVKLTLATYDTQYDAAREVPGYEWVKAKGAQFIITFLPQTGPTLKPFADADKMAVAACSGSMAMLEPPGWVFWFNCPTEYEVKTLLQWLVDNDWDREAKGRSPRIGLVGWQEPFELDMKSAIEEYIAAYPDEYEYGGTYLAPVGTYHWSGEVEKLKGCDYITGSLGTCRNFVKEYYDKGYKATYIGPSLLGAFVGHLVDMFGWEPPLDGWYSNSICRWWNQESPIVDLAHTLLERYRPKQAEEMMHQGSSYLGGTQNFYTILQVVQQAVQSVGAENFSASAFYDAAINYTMHLEGYPEWSFGEGKLYLTDDVEVYKWEDSAEDLIRVSDWLPILK